MSGSNTCINRIILQAVLLHKCLSLETSINKDYTKTININTTLHYKNGFTLIELLVVITVLGILAAGILIIINPLEQFAKTRDVERINMLSQLSRAFVAYMVSHNGDWPPRDDVGDGWMKALRDTGELKEVPPKIPYGPGLTACLGHNNSGQTYCTDWDGTRITIATQLESNSYKSKCPGTTGVYYLWDSLTQKIGVICYNKNDNPWYAQVNGNYNFVQ